MILNRINLLAFGMMAILVLSCQNRRVQRVDPNETIDLSGRWNDTDSKMTSSAMIEQVLSGPWLINHFEANNNEKPVVIGGFARAH